MFFLVFIEKIFCMRKLLAVALTIATLCGTVSAQTKKITLEEFKTNSDGSECEESVYRDRCKVVRSLINDGFSNIHVRFLKPMILAGYSFDDIKELFNQHSDTEEIRDFIKQMGIA